MCGELGLRQFGDGVVVGSSPRVRGTPGSPRPSPPNPAVHPRVCGELGGARECAPAGDGSSPRVRGTPNRPSRHAAANRFIPACAGNSTGRSGRAPHRAVHPRVCGELVVAHTANLRGNGSSPRVRGTRRRCATSRPGRRFIPACAGNSGRSTGCRQAAPVHPRVCGELMRAFRPAAIACGSSPRVRGTLAPDCRPLLHNRFIPACAGNSRPPLRPPLSGRRFIPACAGNSGAPRRRRRRRSVHPRVCGELSCSWRCGLRRRRFIPACAGNSFRRIPARYASAVHPRVCGELPAHRRGGAQRRRFIPACAGNSPERATSATADAGSSPRVRGTRRAARRPQAAPPVHPRVCGELLGHVGERRLLHRFIPACAGNSGVDRRNVPVPPVHPRVCGELYEGEVEDIAAFGSSPRVRGTRPSPARPPTTSRFIPACAGNSGQRGAPARRSAVHPRVCGELEPAKWAQGGQAGSSPRVRGTRAALRPRRGRHRFIPACAGNSFCERTRGKSASVHPRVCGELELFASRFRALLGSSPRVRGTQRQRQRLLLRFIPACAGNSLGESI